MTAHPGEITLLLERARNPHDADARQQLFLRVEHELRTIAEARLRRLAPSPTLQLTALIDDAFMRLLANRGVEWAGRAEFFRVASGVIRRILCDQVRRQLQRARLTPLAPGEQAQVHDRRVQPPDKRLQQQEMFQRLLEALGNLEQEDAEAATVFELRFFGGRCLVFGSSPGEWEIPEPGQELLPFTEVAAILDIPRSTAHARWLRAVTQLQTDLHAFAPAGMEDTAHD